MATESAVGDGFITTKISEIANWGRKNSLWPMPFGTACCAIEYMSIVSAHYDVARFGAEVVRFSPRQSDLLMVMGTITDKMGPVLKRIYEQMPDPKWVISMGACATSGGFYRAYHVMQGIDEIIPVDVYIPGCPPRPEALLYGLMRLQDIIMREAPSAYIFESDGTVHRQQSLDDGEEVLLENNSETQSASAPV